MVTARSQLGLQSFRAFDGSRYRCREFCVSSRHGAHDLLNSRMEKHHGKRQQRCGTVFVFLIATRPRECRSNRPGSSQDYENLENFRGLTGTRSLLGREITHPFHFLGNRLAFRVWDKTRRIAKVSARYFLGRTEEPSCVEPFAGNHCIAVSQARSTYRIELGYYEPSEIWNLVATSDSIATPPEDISDSASIDVATVPFHLNFQRMVDTFRASRYDGDALVEIVGRCGARGRSAEPDLTEADRELLRAIDCTLSGDDRCSARLGINDAFATRQRIESSLAWAPEQDDPEGHFLHRHNFTYHLWKRGCK